MRSWALFTVACACSVAVCTGATGDGAPPTGAEQEKGCKIKDPVARTPSGVIRGSWMETRGGRRFQAFRGMRYAKPPVGELRFKPPVLITRYSGEVDASEEGPACPLPVPPSYYTDEDCLRINVYTPTTNSSKPLPVVFFIHPGGFYAMTGRSDVAGPHYLLERNLVLVTINYRIGALGFISTGDKYAVGNNGMKDQVAALRWVQRNIAAFGGNPDLVTIMGCSAGSISVMLHMISPMTKGLFHRGISISAGPIGKEPTASSQPGLAIKQAELLNCPTNSSKAIMDCLKTKSFREFGDSLPGFFGFNGDPIGLWKPVVELDYHQERYLDIDPADAIRQGRMHAVPHIISQTTDEFFWKAFSVIQNKTVLDRMNAEWETLAAFSLELPEKGGAAAADRLKQVYLGGRPLRANDSASADGLGKMYGDSVIGFPVHIMANMMCRHSPKKVYYYEFAYVGNHSHYEDPTTGKPVGAAHHDDLIYLFTLSYRFPTIELGTLDNQMVEKMTGLVYNFARYADPNPRPDTPELAGLSWPTMTPTNRRYLRVDTEFSVRRNLNEDRMKVWEELYPIEY